MAHLPWTIVFLFVVLTGVCAVVVWYAIRRCDAELHSFEPDDDCHDITHFMQQRR